jgi:hypothetical protein
MFIVNQGADGTGPVSRSAFEPRMHAEPYQRDVDAVDIDDLPRPSRRSHSNCSCGIPEIQRPGSMRSISTRAT